MTPNPEVAAYDFHYFLEDCGCADAVRLMGGAELKKAT